MFNERRVIIRFGPAAAPFGQCHLANNWSRMSDSAGPVCECREWWLAVVARAQSARVFVNVFDKRVAVELRPNDRSPGDANGAIAVVVGEIVVLRIAAVRDGSNP